MEKAPSGLVRKRQGYATEPLRRMVLFFTPLRTIQILSFSLVLVFLGTFPGSHFLSPLDRSFYDRFLKLEPSPKVDPSIVYIGIDRNSLQAIPQFPWPKRYYAAMTRILREWGAKAIVYNFPLTPGGGAPEDDQALLEEFKKTPNFYLPVSLESEGFRNYYYVSQSAPAYNEQAKGIGHINYIQDDDGVVRRVHPFIRINGQLVPHLGIRVAYDALGKPEPTPEKCDFPRDPESLLLIHWAKRWNDVSGYYPFADVLNSYALTAKGETAPIRPEAFQGKICLIGMTASDLKATPVEAASPGLGVVGNVLNTVLTGQYIAVASPEFSGLILLAIALLTGFLLIPFRGVFSILGVLALALLWPAASFALFAWAKVWVGVVAPIFLITVYFLIAFTFSKIQEYREKLYLLSLAVRDELTGLYSMQYISTFLTQALAYAHTFKKPFAVILIDIDDFRKVNDAYGRRTGDIVLQKTGTIIQSALRTTGRAMPDVAGRYMEEEFIVILVGFNLATATFGVAERIRRSIEKTAFQAAHATGTGVMEEKTFHISVSAGVSVLLPDEKSAQKVVERAQEALLKAKTSGKNQTCILNGE